MSKETADLVAQHLVMAGRLMDDDPTQALAHARAARALAGRIGPAREANGLVAYAAGEWTEALSELRAARRMTGQPDHLAVMADCERALGKPERALMVTEDPQAKDLEPASRVELMIVASGARRDLGQADAAVAMLQVPALEGPVRAWTPRLRYAYADALLDAGREDEARHWFARTVEIDEHGQTDAEDRLLELDGLVFDDLLDEDDADDAAVDGQGTAAQADDAEPATAWRATSVPAMTDDAADDVERVDVASADATLAAVVPVDVVPLEHEGVVEAEGEAVGTAEASDPDAGAGAGAEEAQPEESYVDTSTSEASSQVSGVEVAVVTPHHPFSSAGQDEEIPALGRAGSTAIGFLAPSTPPVEPDDDDDLRLFD